MTCGTEDTKPSLRGEYYHDIEECRRVIVRLEDGLAIRKGAQARLGEEWEYEQDRANDAEAANAALAAALEWFILNTNPWECVECQAIAFGGDKMRHRKGCLQTGIRRPEPIRAALSDGGEGWLPPEVRGQVLKTGRALLNWIDRNPMEPFDGDPVLHSMGLEADFRAALDALEVK